MSSKPIACYARDNDAGDYFRAVLKSIRRGYRKIEPFLELIPGSQPYLEAINMVNKFASSKDSLVNAKSISKDVFDLTMKKIKEQQKKEIPKKPKGAGKQQQSKIK